MTRFAGISGDNSPVNSDCSQDEEELDDCDEGVEIAKSRSLDLTRG